MNIPDAAVQAAINAWFEETREHVKSVEPLPEQARRMRLALEAALPYLQTVNVAAVRKQALEEAANLIESHAYISTTVGRSMASCLFARHDRHHSTIAAAIRALSAETALKGQQHDK